MVRNRSRHAAIGKFFFNDEQRAANTSAELQKMIRHYALSNTITAFIGWPFESNLVDVTVSCFPSGEVSVRVVSITFPSFLKVVSIVFGSIYRLASSRTDARPPSRKERSPRLTARLSPVQLFF
jgi:hypothetical protein